jgi:hypothetical protein
MIAEVEFERVCETRNKKKMSSLIERQRPEQKALFHQSERLRTARQPICKAFKIAIVECDSEANERAERESQCLKSALMRSDSILYYRM